MRLAKNGSVGAVTSGAASVSATGAVVVIEALTGGMVIGVLGFSCVRPTVQVAARKTADKRIFMELYLSLIGGELCTSGDLGNSQKGRERSELCSIHRELYHVRRGLTNQPTMISLVVIIRRRCNAGVARCVRKSKNQIGVRPAISLKNAHAEANRPRSGYCQSARDRPCGHHVTIVQEVLQ